MGAGTCCLKCMLILVNVILGIIGLVLLAIGIFLAVAGNDYINRYAGDVIQGISGVAGGSSGSSTTAQTNGGSTHQLDFSAFLKPIATTLIVIGTVTAVVSFAGAFGACCNSRCLLAVYLTFMIVLLLTQFVIAILFFTKTFDPPIRSLALSTLVNDYVDINDFGVYSLLWNYIMFDFKCCGLNNYTDFAEAKLWPRSQTVTDDGTTVTVNLTTPVACCKLEGQFPNVKLVDDFCAYQPTDAISNWKTGCWDPVTTFLSQYNKYIIIAVTVILVFEALVTVIALVIACVIGNEDKVKPGGYTRYYR
jgi:tetraspanin-18